MYCILCGRKIRKGEIAYKTIENSQDEWICDGCITEHRPVDEVDFKRVASQQIPLPEGSFRCPSYGYVVADHCATCAHHSMDGFTYNPITDECEKTLSRPPK